MQKPRFTPLLLTLALLLAWYFLIRIVFITWNQRLFIFHGPVELLRIFWWGCRMDLAAIALLNLPILFLYFLLQYRLPLQLLTRIAFVGCNAIGFALNILDIGYFPFSKHRSNLDLWYVLGDSAGSFGSVLRIYLPLLLFFTLSIWVLIRISRSLATQQPTPRRILPLGQLGLLLLFLLAIRGWETRPLIPATPLLYIDPDKLPLAQNSVVTLSYSLTNRERQMTPRLYFPPDELNKILATRHFLAGPAPDSPLKKNVVLIILEGFSRCYVIPGDRQKAHTPFLDSLIRKSLFFPHAFANGFSSNQGIVAILGGLPALTDEPFFYSPYANTPLHSIGNVLKEKGYNTNFFMGAGRDHFGFGKFARMAGLEHTYWQNDFNDDRFYDGNWGIFDEPFLQYGAHILDTLPRPFFATFFTISAHPPFTIPTDYKERFSFPGQSPAQCSIAYTDYSLQQFFATCRQMPWFKNTLFVFCADHWFTPDDHTTFSYVNNCTIPIIIYDPQHPEGDFRPTLAAQVDLAPTVLDLLGYRGAYSGFGRSLLDSTITPADHYAINRFGESYQIITDEYVLGYDPIHDKSNFLYHYPTDSLLTNNLLTGTAGDSTRRRLETLIRANIQAYRQALTRRSLD